MNMILNKYLSLVITGCFFLMLMLLLSSVVTLFGSQFHIAFSGILIIAFVLLSRIFYNYLRNDDTYKNNRKISSDKKGESYITKGESDMKKVFVIIWVFIMTILLAISFILIA